MFWKRKLDKWKEKNKAVSDEIDKAIDVIDRWKTGDRATLLGKSVCIAARYICDEQVPANVRPEIKVLYWDEHEKPGFLHLTGGSIDMLEKSTA